MFEQQKICDNLLDAHLNNRRQMNWNGRDVEATPTHTSICCALGFNQWMEINRFFRRLIISIYIQLNVFVIAFNIVPHRSVSVSRTRTLTQRSTCTFRLSLSLLTPNSVSFQHYPAENINIIRYRMK